jgi:hypothetical protein
MAETFLFNLLFLNLQDLQKRPASGRNGLIAGQTEIS